MASSSTISTWLVRLQGDQNQLAAQRLWDQISPQLQDLSRRLAKRCRLLPIVDEEDITISVFSSLCDGLISLRFPGLQDRSGLWRLLVRMTVRKVNDHVKTQRAFKRRGTEITTALPDYALELLVDDRPEPDIEAMMEEHCQSMLKALNDPVLELLVLLRLEGYSNEEIAERLGYSRRTVQRMLNIVRDAWSHYLGG